MPLGDKRHCIDDSAPPASPPPACAFAPGPCVTSRARALTCGGVLRYLVPAVAASAVDCLRGDWGCSDPTGVFQCAERALFQECAGAPVDASCGPVVEACPALARRACRAWLAGMNDEGRAKMVACLASARGCAEGPEKCARELLAGSLGCLARPLTITARVDVAAAWDSTPSGQRMRVAVGTVSIPLLHVRREAFRVPLPWQCRRGEMGLAASDAGSVRDGVTCMGDDAAGRAFASLEGGKLRVELKGYDTGEHVESFDVPCSASLAVVVSSLP